MKANEAPEKIHVQPNAHDKWFEGKIPSGLPNGLFVEYIHPDVFINKVINFLNYKLDEVVATRVPGTLIPHHVAKQELIEDFRNYMKVE